MAREYNGVYLPGNHSSMWLAVTAGMASVSIGLIDDSNWAYGSYRGDTAGICFAMEAMGIPKIASAPCIGVYINNGSNRTAGRDERQQSSSAANQGAYDGSVAAGLEDWLPVGTDIQAVLDNEPAYFRSPGSNYGNTNAGVDYPGSDLVLSHDITERMRIYMPHVKGNGLGSHPWRVRGEAGGYTSYLNGTMNHDNGGAMVFDDGLMGTIAANAGRTGHTGLQMMPFDNNSTATGEGLVFSAFLTYPDRGHGYSFTPLTCNGGKKMQEMAAGLLQLDDKYIKAWLRCMDLSMGAGQTESRASYCLIWIKTGQHDATAGRTAVQFQGDLSYYISRFKTIYDSMVSGGEITAMTLGIRFIYDGMAWKRNAAGGGIANMDPMYVGAKAEADIRSDLVVGDHRTSITETEATRIGDAANSTHLGSLTAYQRRNVESAYRLIAAAKAAAGFRKVA